METSTLIILVCNIIIAGSAIYVAFRANRHFQLRTAFDWWNRFSSDEFWRHHWVVTELIDQKELDTVVDRIENNPTNRHAVTYVLSFMLEAATAARFNFLQRSLLVRFSIFVLPYYYEGLLPWIEHRRLALHPKLYHDLDWFYAYTQEHGDKIMEKP